MTPSSSKSSQAKKKSQKTAAKSPASTASKAKQAAKSKQAKTTGKQATTGRQTKSATKIGTSKKTSRKSATSFKASAKTLKAGAEASLKASTESIKSSAETLKAGAETLKTTAESTVRDFNENLQTLRIAMKKKSKRNAEKIIRTFADHLGIRIISKGSKGFKSVKGSKDSKSRANQITIRVKNDKFYERVLTGGSLAIGESYMDDWWDCDAIDDIVTRVMSAQMDISFERSLTMLGMVVKNKIFNMQSKIRARLVGKQHYDVGNDLYRYMLDKNLNYTCAYWRRDGKEVKTLDQAQTAKLDLLCRKLQLEPGMRVLDFGCGWANLAKFMAQNYKVQVLGVTISTEQQKLGSERCKGLDVEIRMQDYRDLNPAVEGKFDRVVSVGLMEHVGNKNYSTYFKLVDDFLKDDGLSLLHTIGGNRRVPHMMDPWLHKYIFPNAILPRFSQLSTAMEGIFKIEDVHNFGLDYDRTLLAWHKNFNQNWNKIKKLNPAYDERFRRMWNYYLLICAGSFRSGSNGLWQIVFSKMRRQKYYHGLR